MSEMKYTKIFLIFFLFMFTFSFVGAHGEGQTFIIDIDGYQIDIDLDTQSPKSNQTIRFNFDIIDLEDKNLSTDFDYVWVRIQSGQKVVFAGGIGRPLFGPVGLTIVLPQSGAYILSVRFQNEGEKVVEGDVSFDIGASESVESDSFLGFLFTTQFFLGGLIGLILGFIISTMKKR